LIDGFWPSSYTLPLGDAEYDAATARLFLAKVQAQLLERLSTGDIVQPRIADPLAKDALDDYSHGR
jgi:hypothetical protein